MSITTFAGLIAYPNTQKIALAEISVSEAIIGTWTLHSGNVYKKTIGNESMTLPGGGTYNYLEEVSGLKYGSTTINTATAVADLATCLTTGSSWYQDVSASLLYVNFTGGNPNVDASLLPIMMSFPMRFATQGISLTVAAGARPFDPLIKNIPMISQINNQLAGGYATTAISSISMNNETGIFDQLLYGYIFEKRAITIRFGGESLPYSEYAIVFKGIIAGVEWTRMGVTFNLQSIQQVLAQTTMPSVTFDAAYPNIDPAFSGGMIPIAYGNFTTSGTPGRDSIKAIGEDEVTNIGVDTVKMRVAYNPLATVDKVSISYDNSVSWTVAALDAAALPTAANKYSTLSAIGGAAARFLDPRGITNDGTNLYVTDSGNHTIRKIVISSGAVTTLAGTAGSSGSADGTGAAARFYSPRGITNDGTNLYVTDTSNQTIRKIVISSGVVTTLAGTAGSFGSTDGTGAAARFLDPRGITNDGTNLYVTDTSNQTIRKIVISSGAVTTLAGTAGGSPRPPRRRPAAALLLARGASVSAR